MKQRNENNRKSEEGTNQANPIAVKPTFYAHSANDEGQKHLLADHLRATAEMAGNFADSFDSRLPAYYTGLWHDIGKFNPEFQSYLEGKTKKGTDHKGAGAKLSAEHFEPLGLLVQGHHGGLQAKKDFMGWLNEKGRTPAAISAIEKANQTLPELAPLTRLKAPTWVKTHLDAEMWLRMVFSSLVDADFIDTENHFSPGNAASRSSAVSISRLWERFKDRQTDIAKSSPSAGNVNQVRSEVYEACLAAAESPKGIFKLAVPTGGGKTLSSLAFALRHAEIHGMRRVVTAVPFISITQQTAAVYRQVIEDDPGNPGGTVLEHHSQVEANEEDEYDRNAIWSRLASENWDAPIVVTTTAQLFNSLFSNRTSATRKLHNLANSVIILDEAQAMPPHLLAPILDGLRQLTDYGTTIVLCTATQPAFQTIEPFADVESADIVRSPETHFARMKRVRYEWKIEKETTWEQAAEIMKETRQALTIVNTKKDALALLEALGDEPALHLSTLLCGRHRAEVINEIRHLLEAGEKCYVVSTQVVEAGVDLDFTTVLRAAGPLDGIIQAAGRCNRNGLAREGRVVIFKPEKETLPPGIYRRATDTTKSLLKTNPELDPDDPRTTERYYRLLYQDTETDAKKIQEKRESWDYPQVAENFRMIDDDTITAIVPNYGTSDQRQETAEIIQEIRNGEPKNARRLARRVQPWSVTIYRNKAMEMEKTGLIAPVMPGLYEWRGEYDRITGIGGAKAADPDLLVV